MPPTSWAKPTNHAHPSKTTDISAADEPAHGFVGTLRTDRITYREAGRRDRTRSIRRWDPRRPSGEETPGRTGSNLLFRWVSLRDRCYFNVSLACPLTQNAREPTRWFPSVLCQDCVTCCVINQSDSIQMIMQFTAFGTDDTRHMSWPVAPLIHVNTVSINAYLSHSATGTAYSTDQSPNQRRNRNKLQSKSETSSFHPRPETIVGPPVTITASLEPRERIDIVTQDQ